MNHLVGHGATEQGVWVAGDECAGCIGWDHLSSLQPHTVCSGEEEFVVSGGARHRRNVALNECVLAPACDLAPLTCGKSGSIAPPGGER
ncbi:MAG TPA: hypothetical protein DIU15_20675 [Deltaproteobacteria bacterium]|nr:hypothetical protein [Deltaproteobacteria bacterium]HCP48464.1 hypothetical protein [Deltaproteobacteria bacterium]